MLIKFNKNPSSKELRQFGLTILVGFGIVGALFYWRGKPALSGWMWAVSSAVGILALVMPRAVKPLYWIWMGWALVMGTVVTRGILVALFFGVVTPLAALFRLFGRDSLGLRRNPAALSYWQDHRKITDKTYYQRLF